MLKWRDLKVCGNCRSPIVGERIGAMQADPPMVLCPKCAVSEHLEVLEDLVRSNFTLVINALPPGISLDSYADHVWESWETATQDLMNCIPK